MKCWVKTFWRDDEMHWALRSLGLWAIRILRQGLRNPSPLTFISSWWDSDNKFELCFPWPLYDACLVKPSRILEVKHCGMTKGWLSKKSPSPWNLKMLSLIVPSGLVLETKNGNIQKVARLWQRMSSNDVGVLNKELSVKPRVRGVEAYNC